MSETPPSAEHFLDSAVPTLPEHKNGSRDPFLNAIRHLAMISSRSGARITSQSLLEAFLSTRTPGGEEGNCRRLPVGPTGSNPRKNFQYLEGSWRVSEAR